jgi:hypothetical protein
MRTVFELLDEIDEFDDLPLTHLPLKRQPERDGQQTQPSVFRTRTRREVQDVRRQAVSKRLSVPVTAICDRQCERRQQECKTAKD